MIETNDIYLPSPITPNLADSKVCRFSAGSLRDVFETTPPLAGIKTAIPIGSIATGN